MQLGQEFMRTKLYPTGEDGELTEEDKERAMNSYNAPDQVNQVNWNLVTEHSDLVNQVRQLIREKQENPIFSIEEFPKIRELVFVERAVPASGELLIQYGNAAKNSLKLNNIEKTLIFS